MFGVDYSKAWSRNSAVILEDGFVGLPGCKDSSQNKGKNKLSNIQVMQGHLLKSKDSLKQ